MSLVELWEEPWWATCRWYWFREFTQSHHPRTAWPWMFLHESVDPQCLCDVNQNANTQHGLKYMKDTKACVGLSLQSPPLLPFSSEYTTSHKSCLSHVAFLPAVRSQVADNLTSPFLHWSWEVSHPNFTLEGLLLWKSSMSSRSSIFNISCLSNRREHSRKIIKLKWSLSTWWIKVSIKGGLRPLSAGSNLDVQCTSRGILFSVTLRQWPGVSAILCYALTTQGLWGWPEYYLLPP